MGNLTEESEFGRVINCNEFKLNKNQNHVRNLFIPKFSKIDFVIFHQNIIGLNSNKLDELSISLSANLPHTVCFREHHLGINEIYTIVLANYRLRAIFCRNTFKNGGVCIFTHDSNQSTNINLNEFRKEKDLEICALKLHVPSYEICIVTIYRSPSRNFQYFRDNLEKILSMILIYSNTIEIIICGDININYLIDPHTNNYWINYWPLIIYAAQFNLPLESRITLTLQLTIFLLIHLNLVTFHCTPSLRIF